MLASGVIWNRGILQGYRYAFKYSGCEGRYRLLYGSFGSNCNTVFYFL